jgi:hypothetical protein
MFRKAPMLITFSSQSMYGNPTKMSPGRKKSKVKVALSKAPMQKVVLGKAFPKGRSFFGFGSKVIWDLGNGLFVRTPASVKTPIMIEEYPERVYLDPGNGWLFTWRPERTESAVVPKDELDP